MSWLRPGGDRPAASSAYLNVITAVSQVPLTVPAAVNVPVEDGIW